MPSFFRPTVYVPSTYATKIEAMETQMCMPLSSIVATAIAAEINDAYSSLSAPQRNRPVSKTSRREYRKRRDAVKVQVGLPAIFADRYHSAYAVLQHSLCARLDAVATKIVNEFKLSGL